MRVLLYTECADDFFFFPRGVCSIQPKIYAEHVRYSYACALLYPDISQNAPVDLYVQSLREAGPRLSQAPRTLHLILVHRARGVSTGAHRSVQAKDFSVLRTLR